MNYLPVGTRIVSLFNPRILSYADSPPGTLGTIIQPRTFGLQKPKPHYYRAEVSLYTEDGYYIEDTRNASTVHPQKG